MKTESSREINTKGFRFNFKNSHLISLSNSFAPCHTLEVIFKTFFTSMRLRYLQSVFYKGSYNFPHRQIKVVQAQIVVVLYGKWFSWKLRSKILAACAVSESVNRICLLLFAPVQQGFLLPAMRRGR